MALTHQQYIAVDTQLQQLHHYLQSLADELCVGPSPLDKHGHTPRAAARAVEQIAELRYLLAVSEARRQVLEHRGQVVQAHPLEPTPLLQWVLNPQSIVDIEHTA